MVYPNQTVSIPVNVTGGAIPLPGTVDYELVLLTPVEQPFLPMQNGSYRGTFGWDAMNGTQAAIVLPIDWSEVGFCTFCCDTIPGVS